MTCWQQLMSKSDFRDVTLVCDDGKMKAHKPVWLVRVITYMFIIHVSFQIICLWKNNITNFTFNLTLLAQH